MSRIKSISAYLLQVVCIYTSLLASCLLLSSSLTRAQEPPYFVTYSEALEEPGNMEIAYKGVYAAPQHANSFNSATLEIEYGVKAWWTTEVYLAGQSTQNDSTIFTGYRWENRFRPLLRDHFINPVLYVEYENISDADRSFLEIVGHDSVADLYTSNAQARRNVKHEIEFKLILSSNVHGWNFSENIIAEKNLTNLPWEFAYALGVSRPLRLAATSKKCVFCRENFSAGLELYGGLGDRYSFGLRDTSHYLAPSLLFNIPKGPSLSFSPSAGLNDRSVNVFWRFKISYEIEQVFSHFKREVH
jgi:hypothetical protein